MVIHAFLVHVVSTCILKMQDLKNGRGGDDSEVKKRNVIDILGEAAPIDADYDPGVGQQAVGLLKGAHISISASCQPMLFEFVTPAAAGTGTGSGRLL
jgi:hypothetical protein